MIHKKFNYSYVQDILNRLLRMADLKGVVNHHSNGHPDIWPIFKFKGPGFFFRSVEHNMQCKK
jgi:hypothetical protein